MCRKGKKKRKKKTGNEAGSGPGSSSGTAVGPVNPLTKEQSEWTAVLRKQEVMKRGQKRRGARGLVQIQIRAISLRTVSKELAMDSIATRGGLSG